MTTLEVVKFVSVGFAVGLLSSSLGIGGGVLLLPVLMYVCMLEHTKAAGTSYAVLAPAVIILAIQFIVKKQTDVVTALWVGIGFAVGGFIGAQILIWSNSAESARASFISPSAVRDALRIGLGFLLVFIGIRFVYKTDNQAYASATAFAVVALSFVIYWACRLTGKHYQRKYLQDEMLRMSEKPPQRDPDYYI